MNLDAHVATLASRHDEIDHEINTEEHRPHPDTILIQDLKRKKLRLKEELTRLRQTH